MNTQPSFSLGAGVAVWTESDELLALQAEQRGSIGLTRFSCTHLRAHERSNTSHHRTPGVSLSPHQKES